MIILLKGVYLMNKHLAYVLLLILFSIITTGFGFAKDGIFIDNKNIQQYNGHLGKWVQLKSEAELNKMIAASGVTEELVCEINGSLSLKNHIFIPYSSECIKELQARGVARKSVSSKDTEFLWPIDSPARISSPFGYRNKRLHEGIDVPAPIGHIIVSAMDGRVVSCGYAGGHGNTILIEHENNFATRYSHNSALLVKQGDSVKKGQVIALAGSTGNSTGPHLHFELRFKNIPLNPLDFLPQDDDVVVTQHSKNPRR